MRREKGRSEHLGARCIGCRTFSVKCATVCPGSVAQGEKKGCLSRRAHPTEETDDHFPGNRPSAARRVQSVEWSLRFAPGVKSPDQSEDDIARRAAMGFARKRSNSVMQWTVAADDDEAELNERKEEHGRAESQQDEKPHE